MSNYSVEERSAIVKKIVASEAVPLQSLCPEAQIYWRGENKTDGKYTKVYNPITGKIYMYDTANFSRRTAWGYTIYDKPNEENGKYVVTSARSSVESYYSRYWKEYDCLEVAVITIPANRGKDGEKRAWSFNSRSWYTDRVFLFYGQIEPFKKDGTLYAPEQTGKFYNKQFVSLMNSYNQVGNHNMHFGKAVKEFTRGAALTSRYYSDPMSIEYPWRLGEWYKKMLPRKVSQRSKEISELKIDDLTAYVNEKYPVRCTYSDKQHSWNNKYENEQVIVFQKTSADEGMFRVFGAPYHDAHKERYRLLVDKKGVPTFMEPNGTNGWRISPANVANRVYHVKGTVYDGWEKMDEVEHLKYIHQIVDELVPTTDNRQGKLELITDLLRHPIVEKVWKAGYHNIAKAIQSNNTIAANLRDVFGAKDRKTGSVTEILGLNKYQLKLLDEIAKIEDNDRNYYYRSEIYKINNIISTIKLLTGMENISSLSNESSNKYFTASQYLNAADRNWRNQLLYTINDNGAPCRRWRYYYRSRSEREEPLTEEERVRMNKIIKLGSKNPEAYKLFSDVVGIFCSLDNEYRPDIDIYSIDSYERLNDVHEHLNNLYSQQQAEARRLYDMKEEERRKELERKMLKLTEKRVEKYEELGTEFSIIVPRSLSELVTEGTQLSICIGGYCNRYAKGDTDLVFLRRTNDITTPFYAIEIINGECIQIHGKYNRWLGNNPEAIAFVKQWLDKRHINYQKEQLLDKATGYCASGILIDGTPYGL